MGLLGDFLSPITDFASTIFPGVDEIAQLPGVGQVIGGAVGTAYGGPAGGAIGASFGGAIQSSVYGNDEAIPDYGTLPSGSVYGGAPVTQAGAFGAIGGWAMRLSPIVAGAIVKLSQKLGGAGGSVAAYGTKVWASLSSWAAKNPGVSLVATLVSLGLTAEEAAHFIAWGATRKRRKRRGGISGRDLKTTRRTMRKVINMSHNLRELCGGVPHRTHHYRHRRRS
jgi:hypothetical protein